MIDLRSILLGGVFFLGAAITPAPAFADGDEFAECMAGCAEAVRMLGNNAYAYEYGRACRSYCVDQYDGGTQDPVPGTGITPIGPGICNTGLCFKV
ncbi:hypothetical protein [Qipengyuania flava]|uniref:hypothetical protein n=1 Tax=Qipengyuania flava TaxID=192812 RepID=UPI001290879E